MSLGFVYVLGNIAMPGVFNIGKTAGSPTACARELSQSAAAALPFEVLCFGEVEDIDLVEQDILERYGHRRLSASRPFVAERFSVLASAVDMASMHFHMTEAGESTRSDESMAPDAAAQRTLLLTQGEAAWPAH
jgi:hypothetical protein